MTLKYNVPDNVQSPKRGSIGAAGIDLFASPAWDGARYAPGDGSKIGTGLYIKIPDGYYGHIVSRSSLASKQGLIVGACIIDSDYQGEIFVNLINTSIKAQTLNIKKAIAQMLILPVIQVKLQSVPFDQVHTESTGRGEGGFGSTDKVVQTPEAINTIEEGRYWGGGLDGKSSASGMPDGKSYYDPDH